MNLDKAKLDSREYYLYSQEYFNEHLQRYYLRRNSSRTEQETEELVRLTYKFYNLFTELGLEDAAYNIISGVT